MNGLAGKQNIYSLKKRNSSGVMEDKVRSQFREIALSVNNKKQKNKNKKKAA